MLESRLKPPDKAPEKLREVCPLGNEEGVSVESLFNEMGGCRLEPNLYTPVLHRSAGQILGYSTVPS